MNLEPRLLIQPLKAGRRAVEQVKRFLARSRGFPAYEQTYEDVTPIPK